MAPSEFWIEIVASLSWRQWDWNMGERKKVLRSYNVVVLLSQVLF